MWSRGELWFWMKGLFYTLHLTAVTCWVNAARESNCSDKARNPDYVEFPDSAFFLTIVLILASSAHLDSRLLKIIDEGTPAVTLNS